MFHDEIEAARARLPLRMAMPYYDDRDSAWLLARRMRGDARIADLRTGPEARFLDRPLLRPLVAGCGGVLRRADVVALAEAQSLADTDDLSRAGWEALGAAFDLRWMDFELSFADWGVGQDRGWHQMSREGGNLVVQLAFPTDHAALMRRYLPEMPRHKFEYQLHPVRRDGRPTLAWARLDIDPARGVALIEEIQSDWLRFAARQVAHVAEQEPRSRHLKGLRAYEADLRVLYGRVWPRAMMLAVLEVLAHLRCHEVWMHQPWTGNLLKSCNGPVSIYRDLPRAFGFDPTGDAPHFLARPRRRLLRKLRVGPDHRKRPIFWRLDL